MSSTATLGYSLTAKQLEANELLASPGRYKLLYGGSRSGKTWLFVRACVMRALRARGSDHGIFRHRFNAVRSSIGRATLPNVLAKCFPGLEVQDKLSSEGFFRFPNDSRIWLGGLDDKDRVEKVLGQEFVTIYLNESSQIPLASAELAMTRLAQNCDGLTQRGYFDLNPVGLGHYTNLMFGLKQNPRTKLPLIDPDNYARLAMNPEDNRGNLSAEYIESLKNASERIRKRFYEGLYVQEVSGALWLLEKLEEHRDEPIEPGDDRHKALQRIVVGVDPSGASGEPGESGNAIGIIVAGIKRHPTIRDRMKATVLADYTQTEHPSVWGKTVCAAAKTWGADGIVAEKNFGGAMVESVIQSANPYASVKLVTASRAKHVRAEPIAARYDTGEVEHAGRFPELEDEYCNFTTAGYVGEESPNRADAAIWALTELFGGDMVPENADVHVGAELWSARKQW